MITSCLWYQMSGRVGEEKPADNEAQEIADEVY
jgi:hypothetical protein